MRKFNIIKKSRKKSEDIDEKIEYLDKECQKAGLQEFMTTSNIYQGNIKDDNQEYSAFQALDLNGYGLALSGADGNTVGGAAIQTGIGNYIGVDGVAYSPINPNTGLRRAAVHITTGLGNSTPLRPGKTIKRGFADNAPDYTMGSAMWFFDPNYNSGQGYWYNLEWGNFENNTGWGFWDTIKTGQFAGLYVFNRTLGDFIRDGVNFGAQISGKISGINFGDNGSIGSPQTTVLTQNRLDDPGFIPIDIKGLSKQGYDYLLDKSEYSKEEDDFTNLSPEQLADIFSDPESEEAQKTAVNIVSNEIKEKPELASKFEQFGKAGETFFKYVTGTLPETIDNEYLGQEYVNSMIASAEPYFGDGGSGDKLVFGDNVLGTTQPPVKVGNTIVVDFNYDFKSNADELKGKKDQLTFMQKTFGEILSNAFGTYSIDASPVGGGGLIGLIAGGIFSKAIELGKLFGGSKHTSGKLTMDLSQIASENPKLLSHLLNKDIITADEYTALNNGEDLPETEPSIDPDLGAKKAYYKSSGMMPWSYLDAHAKEYWRSQAQAGDEKNNNKNNNSGDKNNDNNSGDKNNDNKPIDPFANEVKPNVGGKDGDKVAMATYGGKKDPWDKILSDIDKASDKLKNQPKKDYPYFGRPGSGMGDRWKVKNNKKKSVPMVANYQPEGDILNESVKSAHFDPEVLNVDIEQLRKGILPEFPKDPPPEMINGYSAKSKLAPKTIEGEPFIKITKKDLAKNHRLKDSEIKKFTMQIDAINKYIKENPAELKYVLIRYPKDDPRLAELNWELDQKMKASEEYMDTHFPENEALFKRIQNKIKDNIEKTDPRRIDTSVPIVSEEEARIARERRLSVLERYKKQVDIKPFFNKKTPEIDWKIDYLDKECEKTGINEIMNTSNIYQGNTDVPNTDYENFTSSVINGLPLGISGADGNGAGDAYVGEITADMRLGHAYTGQKGVAISPPHPVTGQRRYASTQVGFAGVFAPLRPGTRQRGFPNSDYVSGGALWYWNPNHNNGEGQPPGLWYNLEFATTDDGSPGKWTFWDTNFMGFFTMNPQLDQIDFAGPNVGALLNAAIQGANLSGSDSLGTPETNVLVQNDLGDPGFLPINIDGLSTQGFNYLRDKATPVVKNYSDLKPFEQEILQRGLNFRSGDAWNRELERLKKIYPGFVPRAGIPDNTLIATTDLSTAFPPSPSDKEPVDPPPEAPDEPPTPPEPNPYPDDKADPAGLDARAIRLGYNDPYYPVNPTGHYIAMVTTAQDILKAKMDAEFYSAAASGESPNYDTESINNAKAKLKQARADLDNWERWKKENNYIWKGSIDSSAEADRRQALLDKDKAIEKENERLEKEIEKNEKEAEEAAAKLRGLIAEIGLELAISLFGGKIATLTGKALGKIPSVVKFFKLSKAAQKAQVDDALRAAKAAKTAEKTGKLSRELLNATDDAIDDLYDIFTKTNSPEALQFHDDLYNAFDAGDTRAIERIFQQIKNSKFSRQVRKPFSGSSGSAGGTGSGRPGSNWAKPEGTMGGGTNPDAGYGSFMYQSYEPKGKVLSEAAKLGHFEPEALNVDINDIRKGIMPEFPKDPPPKLINGYSEKSKLLPKVIEGEPFIKITKKELAKNHRLKDIEIKDFMYEINMINEYIKNNPDELVHAMQRYPKNDPRLAQLNWELDQKMKASEEYMDTHFPENERLFNKLQTKIKQNIDLTDPNKFKGHKEAPKFDQTDISEYERRRQVITRHFKKKKKKR